MSFCVEILYLTCLRKILVVKKVYGSPILKSTTETFSMKGFTAISAAVIAVGHKNYFGPTKAGISLIYILK